MEDGKFIEGRNNWRCRLFGDKWDKDDKAHGPESNHECLRCGRKWVTFHGDCPRGECRICNERFERAKKSVAKGRALPEGRGVAPPSQFEELYSTLEALEALACRCLPGPLPDNEVVPCGAHSGAAAVKAQLVKAEGVYALLPKLEPAITFAVAHTWTPADYAELQRLLDARRAT